jgi:hypothetical protein
MTDQKKDVKTSTPEQKPTPRTIDTTKTQSGVSVFNDGFKIETNNKQVLNEVKEK